MPSSYIVQEGEDVVFRAIWTRIPAWESRMNGHEHFSYLPRLRKHVPVVPEVTKVTLLLCGGKAESCELLKQLPEALQLFVSRVYGLLLV